VVVGSNVMYRGIILLPMVGTPNADARNIDIGK